MSTNGNFTPQRIEAFIDLGLTGSSASSGSTFQAVKLNRVYKATGAFTASALNTSTGYVTIPETGTYLMFGSVRAMDGTNITSPGIGINTTPQDGYWFKWCPVTTTVRKVFDFQRLMYLTKGQRVCLYTYEWTGNYDSSGTSMQLMLMSTD